MAAAMVEQGETQDIQVLRITSAGRFFRCVLLTPSACLDGLHDAAFHSLLCSSLLTS